MKSPIRYLLGRRAHSSISCAAVKALQPVVASVISTLRAPKSSEGYSRIGGGSPLRRITQEQADALEAALKAKGQAASVYVGMRYWKPFTEEAIEQVHSNTRCLCTLSQIASTHRQWQHAMVRAVIEWRLCADQGRWNNALGCAATLPAILHIHISIKPAPFRDYAADRPLFGGQSLLYEFVIMCVVRADQLCLSAADLDHECCFTGPEAHCHSIMVLAGGVPNSDDRPDRE